MRNKKLICLFLLVFSLFLFTGCAAEADANASSTIESNSLLNRSDVTVSDSSSVTDNKDSEDQTINTPNIKPDDSTFSIHFIDVGQADAALVECDGEYMLIDGGNVADSSKIYSVLKSAKADTLKYIFGSHLHEDHIGGLSAAYKYANVEKTFCATKEYTSEAFKNFAKAAKEECGEILIPSVGDTYTLGSAAITVLGVNSSEDANNSSIVLKIEYGDTSFLFTGDAEREAEQVIIDSGLDLSATLLKAGHHGSETSTSYRFLREVMPDYAVISVGEGNSYGHPTDEVLSRLRDADVKVYRTDLQGDIYVTSDGSQISISTVKNLDADTLTPGSAAAAVKTENTPSQSVDNLSFYIGNVNSKAFHKENCKTLPAEKNRIYFDTRDEAIEQGYHPCGNCKP